MPETAVTQQSPLSLRCTNEVQATGDKDAAKEVIPEDAVTKDVADKVNASNSYHTHY